MRDIFRFFGQTYSAVRTNDRCERNRANGQRDWAENGNGNPYGVPTVVEPGCENNQFRGSLKASRTVNNGFSILDVFFNQPTKGSGRRWPKGMSLFVFNGIFFKGHLSNAYISRNSFVHITRRLLQQSIANNSIK